MNHFALEKHDKLNQSNSQVCVYGTQRDDTERKGGDSKKIKKNNDPPLQTLIPYSNYMVIVSHSDVG